MRPQGEKFWKLGGLTGWSRWTDVDRSSLAVSDAHGLRLAADPNGPLSLANPDGSIGGLVLPRGMALDASNTLYILVDSGSSAPLVKRFDPESRAFIPLPEVGGEGTDPRRLLDPRNIAISDDKLFVVEAGNRRVQVFDIKSLALLEIIDSKAERSGWDPVDLAEHGGHVFILDASNGRVYRRSRTGHLVVQFEVPQKAGQWSRIIVDRAGSVYLLNTSQPDRPFLEIADAHAPPINDAGAVRDLFDDPWVRLDERDIFCLPETLTRACARRKPTRLPSSETPLALCPPFDRQTSNGSVTATPTRTTKTAQGWWLLYVVEREQSLVNAFTAKGHLRHSWGSAMDWQPCDVAARGRVAYILDERSQVVYRHQGGLEALRIVLQGDPTKTSWSRIATDQSARIYLYTPGEINVQLFDSRGASCGEIPYVNASRYFQDGPAAPPIAGSGLYFARDGTRVASVDPSQPVGKPVYQTSGTWQSIPFDSDTYRCQWHRIEISLSSFPTTSKIDILTYAHQDKPDVYAAPDSAWQSAHTLVAPIQNTPSSKQPSFDFLVQSGAGRFLSMRIRVQSDGFGTPAIETIKIYYPRQSYLQYLPAIFSEDDDGRVFMERFLSVFQTEWDGFDKLVDEDEKYFDPDAVPDGPFLQYLATQWLGLPMEQTWNDTQKRRLLSAIPKIYPHRGQLAGLRDFVQVYLANLAGLETAEVASSGFPSIVESFRERQHLVTSEQEASRLGHGAPLWSNSVVRRLQVGVFSQEGAAALVSTGDPPHDVFNVCAHRFRVSIPAGWINTSSDERMLRRAINTEKPAHTIYDLRLVDARFRVGVQSTVGVDTIVGPIPVTILRCGSCEDVPPSLPPSGRLRYDTILGGLARDEMKLAPARHLGDLLVLA